MSFTFRPAKRENTPLIIGLAGPSKSGKTYSAHRLARGLANGGPVAMINAEGAKGHQYAETFDYLAADIDRPYRPQRYTEALRDALALDPRPAVVIIDSMSHMHDGPGGLLEWHEEELDRMAGNNQRERDKKNWTAWIKPKAAENEFIYTMLEADCHLILCFRAKEKLRIVTGRPPIDLGWQPIAGDRVTFETLFTLTLPPHSKGIPDLAVSDMREAFEKLVPAGKPLDEELGRALAQWARGGSVSSSRTSSVSPRQEGEPGSIPQRTEGERASGSGSHSGGEWADAAAAEKIIKPVLELASKVSNEAHDATVGSIADHRAKYAGKVNLGWFARLREALEEKLPADETTEPHQESMFQAPPLREKASA